MVIGLRKLRWIALVLAAAHLSTQTFAQVWVDPAFSAAGSQTLLELRALTAKKRSELDQKKHEILLLEGEVSDLRLQLAEVQASGKTPQKIGLSLLFTGTVISAVGVLMAWAHGKSPGKVHRSAHALGLQAIALGVLANAAAGGTLYVSIKKIEDIETLVNIASYGIWLRQTKAKKLEADLTALEQSLR